MINGEIILTNYNKDNLLRFVYDLEKEKVARENGTMPPYGESYIKTKKKKIDGILQAININIEEYFDEYAYKLPNEVAALIATLLIEEGKKGTLLYNLVNAMPDKIKDQDLGKLHYKLEGIMRLMFKEKQANELSGKSMFIIDTMMKQCEMRKEIKSKVDKGNNKKKKIIDSSIGEAKLYEVYNYNQVCNYENLRDMYPLIDLSYDNKIKKVSELEDAISLVIKRWEENIRVDPYEEFI